MHKVKRVFGEPKKVNPASKAVDTGLICRQTNNALVKIDESESGQGLFPLVRRKSARCFD
ncbi:MAG: hypothetical protein HY043_02455 [Verrucomicrobia bacterium]|nr:hypothetical protein [Verrucomicrobiota bacterium]